MTAKEFNDVPKFFVRWLIAYGQNFLEMLVRRPNLVPPQVDALMEVRPYFKPELAVYVEPPEQAPAVLIAEVDENSQIEWATQGLNRINKESPEGALKAFRSFRPRRP